MFRGYRYRLYPTQEQAARLQQYADVCRFVYNLALEQREKQWTYYRDSGTPLNYFQQSKELKQLRAEFDWIAAVPSDCEMAALKDLDTAFARFFQGLAKYPNYHRRGEHDGFRCRGRECGVRVISKRWSEVRVPKIGWVRYRNTRPFFGEVKTVTFSLDAVGWHVGFDAEIGEPQECPPIRASVGIDRGIANTIALSTGELYSLPDVSKIEGRRRSAQRVVSRRVKGSKGRTRAQRRARALGAKIARIRLDWHHKMSRRIADRFGTVVIEDLNINKMRASGPGKRGLNRSITHQAWGVFDRLLAYKLEERGGSLSRVNPAYTSQTCSCCGVIDKASRESQAVFACRHCGFTAHADTNAATNILRRSTAFRRMEAGHYFKPPDEVRTIMVSA
jgi:putative transposase